MSLPLLTFCFHVDGPKFGVGLPNEKKQTCGKNAGVDGNAQVKILTEWIEEDDERIEENEIDSYFSGPDPQKVDFKFIGGGETKKRIHHVAARYGKDSEKPPLELVFGLGDQSIANDETH